MSVIDQLDQLEDLALNGETWELAIRAHLIEYPDPVVAHAAATTTMAIAGLRSAIAKIGLRADRAERSAANRAIHAAEQAAPKRDKLIAEMAAARGVPYEEQETIVLEARRRYRAIGEPKPLGEQVAAAPLLGVKPRG